MVDAVKEGILSFQGGWLRIIVESEVAHVPPEEHAQQCAAEQIVDVPFLSWWRMSSLRMLFVMSAFTGQSS